MCKGSCILWEYCEHFNVAQLMIFRVRIFMWVEVGTYDKLGFLLAGKKVKREPWFCCLLHFVWIYIYQFVLCGHLMPGLTVAKLRMMRLISDEGCVKVMQNCIWFEQAFVWNGFSFSISTNSAITLHNHLYNEFGSSLFILPIAYT